MNIYCPLTNNIIYFRNELISQRIFCIKIKMLKLLTFVIVNYPTYVIFVGLTTGYIFVPTELIDLIENLTSL